MHSITLKPLLISLLAASAIQASAQTFTLDSCRSMALNGNKELMIARQNIDAAKWQNRQAFAAYLPAIDFNGGYMYNQRDISIFDSDQMLPTKSFNLATQSYEYDLVMNPMTGQPLTTADGQYVPQTVAVIPKDAMTFDIHNVFFGAITLTQPVFMGGKIVAMNRIARAAEKVAGRMCDLQSENVIYAVDAAYWQVVSLRAKQDLAQSYVELLDSLCGNVHKMYDQGVCTRSDVLSVDVKLNAAQVDLVKVQNGLSLSRMLLAQVCGLPIDSSMTLADEGSGIQAPAAIDQTDVNIADVYARRPDLLALEQGVYIAEQQRNVARSEMLPTLAVIGAYSFSNPNMFDGFKKRFSGAFSVGAMLSVPIWHWGGNYSKMKIAESEAAVMRLKLDDARDKVNLQVSQASYKASEAMRTYSMTCSNLEKADDNLRSANLAFREGMATAENVMEAQTAWLKAHSEQIDAMIDVRLCNVYLSKVLGTL